MHIQSMMSDLSIEKQLKSVQLVAQYFALLNIPKLIMQGDSAWKSSDYDS